jgi:hypothetical protein
MPDSHPLDREAVEKLFGIKRRQANYLMSKFKGYAVGQSTALTRSDLLERIDEMSGQCGVAAAEIQEKIRAVSFINTLQRKPRPKRIPPPPPRAVGTPLPAGIRLVAPGELVIEFTTPEELLSRNLALSQSAIADFASFALGLEYAPTRNGDCTVDDDPLPADIPPPPASSGDAGT